MHRTRLIAALALSAPATFAADQTPADKSRIVASLISEGLLDPADASAIQGGATAGVFPPVQGEGSSCPRLPQPYVSAPGSAFGGHHSYPGGLPLHEDNNGHLALQLASGYATVYDGPSADEEEASVPVGVSRDIVLAAPLWHDWAKTLVFQWNEDGTEFTELNFGGVGTNDAWGKPGDSRTGGHHIIGVVEAMKRGLEPDFVITQASAHSAPTGGNEYKVVNWIRAAAIVAQVDPLAAGLDTIPPTWRGTTSATATCGVEPAQRRAHPGALRGGRAGGDHGGDPEAPAPCDAMAPRPVRRQKAPAIAPAGRPPLATFRRAHRGETAGAKSLGIIEQNALEEVPSPPPLTGHFATRWKREFDL